MKGNNLLKTNRGEITFTAQIILWVLAIILILTFMPIINIGTYSANVQSATDLLTSRGYVVLASGEYALIAKEATASAAVTAAQNAVIAAQNSAATVLADLHAMQYVYPVLAASVTLPADGANPWTYGALTTVVPINTITSSFNIHGISISNMSVTSSYIVKITYGAADTVWGYFRISRGGAAFNSSVIQIQGAVIPANSAVKMQVADAGGIGTLDISIYYHLAQ